eukprot:s1789_g6.t1
MHQVLSSECELDYGKKMSVSSCTSVRQVPCEALSKRETKMPHASVGNAMNQGRDQSSAGLGCANGAVLCGTASQFITLRNVGVSRRQPGLLHSITGADTKGESQTNAVSVHMVLRVLCPCFACLWARSVLGLQITLLASTTHKLSDSSAYGNLDSQAFKQRAFRRATPPSKDFKDFTSLSSCPVVVLPRHGQCTPAGFLYTGLSCLLKPAVAFQERAKSVG